MEHPTKDEFRLLLKLVLDHVYAGRGGQSALALRLGVSPGCVNYWRTGRSAPWLGQRNRFARLFLHIVARHYHLPLMSADDPAAWAG